MQDRAAPQADVVEQARAYAFASFRLDLELGALLRHGTPVALRPKSFDVLHYLVRHPQRLVSREELIEAVWPRVVVIDNSLTQCLIEIRKALGDDGKTMVRTVQRRGYVFDIPVQVVEPGQQASPQPEVPAEGPTPRGSRLPSRWTLAALLVLAAAVGAAWWRLGSMPETLVETVPAQPPLAASIAVLPFVDMSPAGDQEYLADGIAEEILNLLAQVRDLTVIARTSSFSFKDQQADIGTIARRLNVAHVLEGSVRKDGDRVRVTVQLVDGANGAHLWSRTYEERLEDVFRMQDAIALGVVGELQASLLGAPSDVPLLATGDTRSADPQAWELYLRGKYFYGRRMAGDGILAQDHFERALAADPALAPAWVALAATYNVRMGNDFPADEKLTAEVALPLMREALVNALALDPDNPEALLRMSFFSWREGDEALSFAQFERAMQNGRNHALVQSILGGTAYALGDPVTAAELQGRAAALDPVSSVQQSNLGAYLYSAGRLEEAEIAFQRADVLNPADAIELLPMRVWLAIHRQDYQAAAERAGRMPAGPLRDQAEAMLAFQAGNDPAADAALARLLESADPATAVNLALVYAFRNEADEAFRQLESAVEYLLALGVPWEAEAGMTELLSSPFLRPLHGDPRWAAWREETRKRLHDPEDDRLVALLQRYVAERADEFSSAHGPMQRR
jgi:TolB-like protein/DNA-binding winged helix-turn-helix (wHTH) protein/Tfp pilus assembly protein PilF